MCVYCEYFTMAMTMQPKLRTIVRYQYPSTYSIHAGNVLAPGVCERWGPFDAIHVGAAADTLPRVLVEQLRPGGRMVIPVGPRNDYQVLQVVDKGEGDEEVVSIKHLFYVRYVPLTQPHEGA